MAQQDQSTFDSAAYLAANPDVAAAIGQPGVETAWDHYQNYGKNEGRQASWNDTATPEAPVDYKQQAADLENQIYANYGANMNYDQQYYQLQDIKSKDPQAYYENQLKFLGQQVGWQIGQNRNDRNAPIYDQIKSLSQEAIANGADPNQVQSWVGGAINTANSNNQQRIVNEQQAGGAGSFWKGNLIGLAGVAAAGLGAGALDGAFAAGAGAELAGPTYGELGVTGLDASGVGPSYAEMGYNGLNQGAAIDAANSASTWANIKDGASYANKIRQLYGAGSSIAKLLGGGSGSGSLGGVDPQALVNGLRNNTGTPTTSTTPSWDYQSNPWLTGNTKTSPAYAQQGLDVSGTGSANMDMSRNNALMASLLRTK